MLLSRTKKATVTKRYPAIEMLGWLGVIVTLTAYGLVSLEVISPSDILYPALNLFSAIAIATETYIHRDFQPFWLNIVWGAIALFSLSRILILIHS
ncbi:MAG: hypothetical protein JWL75_495 [Parcubacteria group bacterium]|nr:hypothetical protein [Parcubacteria group bacterium]